MHIPENGDGECRAGAINRAQRTVQESAIDQTMLLAGDENGFIDPADEAVEQEPQEVVFKCDNHRRASISA